MRHLAAAFVLALLAASPALSESPPAVITPNPPIRIDATRPVDLVIVLDTSGSMEDLLDSARARVWDIVNELGRMTPTPELRVGLVSFGSDDNSSADAGFVVVQSDLTQDLDALYGKLMALETNGGQEMVGWALQAAVDRMSWSPDAKGLRLIFIAGNESAEQGMDRVDFRAVAEAARRRTVFQIHAAIGIKLK